MEVVHPQVAGIDVHKKVIWVAVRLPGEGPGQRALTVRRFKTFWRALQKMAAWLCGLGVTDAAMKRVKNGRVYIIPAGEQTTGHGTTGNAKFYKQQLQELLQTAPHLGK